MITKQNLPTLLIHLGFTEQNQIYRKVFHGQYELSVDFKAEKIPPIRHHYAPTQCFGGRKCV